MATLRSPDAANPDLLWTRQAAGKAAEPLPGAFSLSLKTLGARGKVLKSAGSGGDFTPPEDSVLSWVLRVKLVSVLREAKVRSPQEVTRGLQGSRGRADPVCPVDF